MWIGYGSVSVYDSIRHDLFFNRTTNCAYFEVSGRKYTIKLTDIYLRYIQQNKLLWVTLTQHPPSAIHSNTQFNDIRILVM
jgi:hypothetical protein